MLGSASRRGDVRRNTLERALQVLAHRADAGDHCDRDQAGQQAIFDRGSPLLVRAETTCELIDLLHVVHFRSTHHTM